MRQVSAQSILRQLCY